MGFIHLHDNSHYSLHRGTMSIRMLVKAAEAYGMNAVALTDCGNMCGAMEFYTEALKADVKPIIGQEFSVEQNAGESDASAQADRSWHSLILLAENETGYKNLLRLSTLSGIESPPHVSIDAIGTSHQGLIALSGDLEGLIPALILDNRKDEARHAAETLLTIFGRDHFYLELQDHGMAKQQLVNDELKAIGADLGIGLVAANGCCFLTAEDAEANTVLRSMRGIEAVSGQCYFKTAQEMEELFADCPEALHATQTIADRCHLTLPLFQPELPKFSVPDGFTADTYLHRLVMEGAMRRYPDGVPPEAQQRIDYELSFIASRSFADYFLIVHDYISYARQQGIMVGPGRGSAPGSIAAYCLGITQLDPIPYGLLFERFICHTRPELPDIDVDICPQRREEVLHYLIEKYGTSRVAEIMHCEPFMPSDFIKTAVAMNFPKRKIRLLAETALTSFQKHWTGFVISPTALSDSVPLFLVPDSNTPVTQYDRHSLDAAGLVVMHLLSLDCLSLIDQCLKRVKEKGIDFDLSTIPLDDPATYAMLCCGDTAGVFQYEGNEMQTLLRKLAPSCFNELFALIALYRPGPIIAGILDAFVLRKHHPEKIDCFHPLLEPVLRDTFGLIIYQEQIMHIARIMGNFSMADSDKLRKAMSRKRTEIIDRMKPPFLAGAKELGFNAALAKKVYAQMSFYGEFTFNKSHAAAYGLISYQTAYLKANFREESKQAYKAMSAGLRENG